MITEDLLREFVDVLPVPTWLARPDGERRHLNREGERLLGVTGEKFSGRGWLNFIHPHDVERIIDRWYHSVRTGVAYDAQLMVKRAAGDYCAIRARAVPLRSSDGDISGWIGAWTELDEECSHAAELTALVRAIEATGVARVHRLDDLAAPETLEEQPGVDWLVASAPVQVGEDVLGETMVAISRARLEESAAPPTAYPTPLRRDQHEPTRLHDWRGDLSAIELLRDARAVRYQGRSVALTPKQFAVLDYLLQRRGAIVTPDELSSVAWGHVTFGQHNFIQVQVSRVRKRLREVGLGAVIENVYGSGWIIPA